MLLIRMTKDARVADISAVIRLLEENDLAPMVTKTPAGTNIAVIGDERKINIRILKRYKGITKCDTLDEPFKLASRKFKSENTIINVGDVRIGAGDIVVMAGPCAVESRQQTLEIAKAVKKSGGHILRGGAFKPRTSPYSFRGLKEEGLKILSEARKVTGLPVVTEVMSAEEMSLVERYADILQVGARNMQNYSLLDEVGKSRRPVLLKRGMMSTIEELLLSAEYILAGGNQKVILCERGIRTFEKYTRNTMDISAIPLLKKLTHLPVIADPSHASGIRDLVIPLSRAALVAGADGIMVEVHPRPDQALSDGQQSLDFNQFTHLMHDIKRLVRYIRN